MWLDRTHRALRSTAGHAVRSAVAAAGGGIGLAGGTGYVPAGGGAAGRGAAVAAAARRAVQVRRPRSGATRKAGEPANGRAAAAAVPGLMTSTFKGGYTYSLWRGDVTTNTAARNLASGSRAIASRSCRHFQLAGDHRHLQRQRRRRCGGGGGGGGAGAAADSRRRDEWDRYYSLRLTQPDSKPVLLTTTDGMIEDATDVAISPDGKTFYYCTNAKDIERRHIWAVPVGGGEPKQVTTGDGIETYPAPLSSGKTLATISATWNMPNSVGVWDTTAPARRRRSCIRRRVRASRSTRTSSRSSSSRIRPTRRSRFHNQVFVPKDIKPGEKRPAMIFVHGGPVRQMLLGYHYRYVYHQFYARQ